MKEVRIAVAGTGYVELSIATLLAQHHPVVAVEIILEKVEMIVYIQDECIEKYFTEKEVFNSYVRCGVDI